MSQLSLYTAINFQLIHETKCPYAPKKYDGPQLGKPITIASYCTVYPPFNTTERRFLP